MKPTPPLNTTPVDESGLTPTAMKTSTPRRGQLILAGIGEQNEPAIWEGRKGFWVQGDCLFIEAGSPQAAIAAYRKETVATSHNHFCGSIMREKDRFRADAIELENQSLMRRLEEVEHMQRPWINAYEAIEALKREQKKSEELRSALDLSKQESKAIRSSVIETVGGVDYEGNPTSPINYLQRLRILVESEAKLTALRTAAEGAMKALELANVTDEKFNEKNADFIEAALAALRAVLEEKQ